MLHAYPVAAVENNWEFCYAQHLKLSLLIPLRYFFNSFLPLAGRLLTQFSYVGPLLEAFNHQLANSLLDIRHMLPVIALPFTFFDTSFLYWKRKWQ